MVVEKIRKEVTAGMVIPKPKAKADFKVKGWGTRRGEPALVYLIPNHKSPGKPYQKGITISEFEAAYRELQCAGGITRVWFDKRLSACSKEGSCNYTTIGGVLELIGVVKYVGNGFYDRI